MGPSDEILHLGCGPLIAVDRFALFDVWSALTGEMGFVEGRVSEEELTLEHDLIRSVHLGARLHGEHLMQLASEWLIRAAPERQVSYLLTWNDPEDALPLIELGYRLIWGDLPEGPPPLVRMFKAQPAQSGGNTAAWKACRAALYGETEDDLPRLRELAARADLVDGRGRPLNAVPCGGSEFL